MQFVGQRILLALLATLLVGVAIIAALACQMHAVPSEPMHTAPIGHQQHSALGSAPCLVAVLPVITTMIVLVVLWFSAPMVMLTPNTSPFPVFHPPRPSVTRPALRNA
jgi:hypothetical protein